MTDPGIQERKNEAVPPKDGYGAYGYDGNPPVRPDREDSVFWYYIDIIIRRIWVVVTVLIIVLVIGVVKAFREPRVYQSAVRVLIEKNTPKLMQFQGVGQDYPSWDPDFYNTQAGIVKSRAVMEFAFRDVAISNLFTVVSDNVHVRDGSFLEELRETMVAALGAAPQSPPEPWEMLRAHVVTEPVKNTHFINVIAESIDPEKAALIANSVARAFEQYSLKEKVDLLGESFSYLEKEKEKEGKAVDAAEETLKKFLEKTPGLSLSDTGGQGNPTVQRMGELNTELGKTHLVKIELMAELAAMKGIAPRSGSDIKASSDVLFSSPVVRRETALMGLRSRLEEAERSLQLLSNTYGAEHPLYRAAETNISLLRNQFLEGFNQAILSREKDVDMLAKKEDEIQKQYDEQKKNVVGLSGDVNIYVRLKSEVDRHRRLYESLVSRLLEVDVSGGLVQGNVKVVDRAKVPSKPARPDRLRITLFSLLIGLFLGGGLAFVFENLDQSVKTPEDLKERTGLPLLGFIPRMSDDNKRRHVKHGGLPPTQLPDGSIGEEGSRKKYSKSDTQDSVKGRPAGRGASISLRIWRFLAELFEGVIPVVEDVSVAHEPLENIIARGMIVTTEPESSATEAFRHVRTNLFFSVPAGEVKVIVLTSSRPGEGKTTTCTNLAAVIAQAGQKVLLIDADLHRPMVRKILQIESKVGLTDVLTGKTDWHETIRQPVVDGVPIGNLYVMCSGTKSPSPSELVGSQAMKALISQVRECYDWVILDTPPVLFVSDASIVGAFSDGVVLVVKSGTSARSFLARAKDQLEIVHARIMGTILNNMHVTLIGRHYSYYYYHGYSRYSKNYHESYYGNTGSTHGDEKAHVVVEPVKNIHSINVIAESIGPEKAVLIANSVAKAVEQDNLKEKIDLPGESFSYLEKEKEEKAVTVADEKAHVVAEPVKNTHSINVIAESIGPEKAVLIANSVAKTVEQDSLKEKIDLPGESFSYLEKEKEGKVVDVAEETLKKFPEKTPGLWLSDTGGQGNPTVQRMVELNTELSKTHLVKIELMAELEAMKGMAPRSGTDIKVSIDVLFSSPVVHREAALMDFRSRLEVAERSLQLWSKIYGAEHPLYRAAETNISLLRNQFLEGFNQAILSREKDVAMLAKKEDEIQKQYDEQKKTVIGL